MSSAYIMVPVDPPSPPTEEQQEFKSLDNNIEVRKSQKPKLDNKEKIIKIQRITDDSVRTTRTNSLILEKANLEGDETPQLVSDSSSQMTVDSVVLVPTVGVPINDFIDEYDVNENEEELRGELTSNNSHLINGTILLDGTFQTLKGCLIDTDLDMTFPLFVELLELELTLNKRNDIQILNDSLELNDKPYFIYPLQFESNLLLLIACSSYDSIDIIYSGPCNMESSTSYELKRIISTFNNKKINIKSFDTVVGVNTVFQQFAIVSMFITKRSNILDNDNFYLGMKKIKKIYRSVDSRVVAKNFFNHI